MKRKLSYLLLALVLQTATTVGQTINNGTWRGIIHYDSVDVPFLFEWQNVSETLAEVTIKNGEEIISIPNVSLKEDSLFIPMHVFDAVIKAQISNGKMTGEWHKHYRQEKGPLFTAEFDNSRFRSDNNAKFRAIEPRWEFTLEQSNGTLTKAIGLFSQNKNHIEATIMTEVGDFRYFEGILKNDSIQMSSFDGVHAFLLEGAYKNKKWEGKLHYEYDYAEKWVANYKDDAELTNPFVMNEVAREKHKPYYDILTAGSEFNAIDAELLEGKVVIIQLMGTWCPNSLDQTNYLTKWYEKNSEKNIELISVAYEPGDATYGQKRIMEYKKNLNIPYTMYVGGRLSKGQAALAFPNLNKINAFPTLIIIDKQGYIRNMSSYFNGPATGPYYYDEFDREFNGIIDALLSE